MTASRPESLDGFPVTIEIPVQWGEMDAYDHVNNVVFFRYFESARVRYLERCGFTDSYREDRVGAILHSTSCRFRRALFYPDRVTVGARVTEMETDRFTMEYRVVSREQDSVAAEGTGVVVSFDYEAEEKTALPESVRAGVRDLETETEEADPVEGEDA